jgi:hypothetical protein
VLRTGIVELVCANSLQLIEAVFKHLALQERWQVCQQQYIFEHAERAQELNNSPILLTQLVYEEHPDLGTALQASSAALQAFHNAGMTPHMMAIQDMYLREKTKKQVCFVFLHSN